MEGERKEERLKGKKRKEGKLHTHRNFQTLASTGVHLCLHRPAG